MKYSLIRYPILKAIYGQSHPEYSSYMYLLAPISLVVVISNLLQYVIQKAVLFSGIRKFISSAIIQM